MHITDTVRLPQNSSLYCYVNLYNSQKIRYIQTLTTLKKIQTHSEKKKKFASMIIYVFFFGTSFHISNFQTFKFIKSIYYPTRLVTKLNSGYPAGYFVNIYRISGPGSPAHHLFLYNIHDDERKILYYGYHPANHPFQYWTLNHLPVHHHYNFKQNTKLKKK